MTVNHRPAYHFLPERDWMNDPNGLIQWQGQTHLFYQYTPGSALSGVKYWGHAVSTDLVHWQHWPVAIAPTPGGPDAGGIWSGCAVDNNGVPTAIYTGVDPQVVCLASSTDGLRTWQKHPANPVIAGPPPALAEGYQNQFRDPYVWREGGDWHLVIACMRAGGGGMILRYRSADLAQWAYVGVLLAGDPQQTEPFPSGTMWECPNYFALDGWRVLLYSAYSEIERKQYPVYYAASHGASPRRPPSPDRERQGRGQERGERSGALHYPQTEMLPDQPFSIGAQGILAHGPAFYAPHGRRLDDGRMVIWGWLKETRPDTAQVAEGWSGSLSLPLVLTWRPTETGGALSVAPAEELKALRGQHWHVEGGGLAPGAIHGDCLEIEAVLESGGGLRLRASPDGAEHTDITYNAERQQVTVDTRAASLDPAVERGIYTLPASPDTGGQARLRIFLDRSALEVFTPEGNYMAARIYPTREDSLGAEAMGRLAALEAWAVQSIW